MKKFLLTLSPDRILSEAGFTLRRFPLVIAAAVASSLSVIAFEATDNDEWIRSIMIFSTAIIAFFVAATTAERGFRRFNQWTLNAVVIAAGAGYFFWLPLKPDYPQIFSHLLIVAGLHLLAAFAPFRSSESTGFWQFNKTLFLNFLQALLYTYVLYAGMAVALLSIHNLLGINISDKTYFRLWVLMQGVFNTWFFLSKMPKDLSELNTESDYPGGLKIFTQYVLLPIVTVYLAILYAYMFKIGFTGELPKGWVAYLVLGFSVAGIFSILLIHPVRLLPGNEKLALFVKGFYWALILPVMLLFWSITYRLSEYGITENRYLVFALAIWLAGVVAIMIKTGGVPIRVIPVGLCILSFVAAVGPFSALNVAGRSQAYIVEKLVSTDKDSLTFEQTKQLGSSVKHLMKIDKLHLIKEWFPVDSVSGGDKYEYDAARTLMQLAGYTYISEWETEEKFNENKTKNIYFSNTEPTIFNIKDYDLIINDHSRNGNLTIDSVQYKYSYDYKTFRCRLSSGNSDVFDFKLDTLIASRINYLYPNQSGDLTFTDYESGIFEAESAEAKIKVMILYGNVVFKDSLHAEPSYLTTKILVNLKRGF